MLKKAPVSANQRRPTSPHPQRQQPVTSLGGLALTVCLLASGFAQSAQSSCGQVRLSTPARKHSPKKKACADHQLPSHRCLTFMTRRGSTEKSACQLVNSHTQHPRKKKKKNKTKFKKKTTESGLKSVSEGASLQLRCLRRSTCRTKGARSCVKTAGKGGDQNLARLWSGSRCEQRRQTGEILTVSGGRRSAEDAQSIKGNHMQEKNHLPG